MTSTPSAVATATAPTPVRPSYGERWRSVPREVAYLLVAFPLALVGFGVTIGLFSAGAGMLAILIGILFIVGALYVARGFGTASLALLRFAGRPAIEKPEWQDARAASGFVGWVRATLGNGHYWLYLLHVMVVEFFIATITWSITVTWLAVGLGGISYWFWDGFIPDSDRDFFLVQWIVERFGGEVANPAIADSILQFIFGVIFLATLPFVTRGLTTLHWVVARGMLGAFRSDALQREVVTLSQERGAAVSAEGQSLRRLERDIHDGPQQRLVRLQMDIAAAERQLDTDPEKTKSLLADAMRQSKDALEELRALSRGFAPPILLDRGLVAAIESVAIRGPIAAQVTNELPDDLVIPQEIERTAYFVAAEALTNAAKHAGASEARVRVGVDGAWLTVDISDDGSGGATLVDDHGLAGLHERLRGIGGVLSVDSPVGGPTTVSARLPLTYP
ncbi:signal transduction histidine kinase [Microbacteriaceae bacterium SG_E_30_P1]|uniref:histidine kinase n=1 Tax=Antiquaquibacter oligotrophicus TaxID=2880260 RepID=A0ABT6KMM7_9MICO|nr:sensor histidine kinase [Antiquaquibacter oligotrophicus]MDH6181261.1 signal transduction histidine kinase [Antiquaquibacter oligotrophicus]UDF13044.1 sensor histidine kinase [Antiquaquibacter oligotrophicus]